MNRKIRKGVFETNSSSVHSLVISNDGREPSEFKLNKDGEIEIDFWTVWKRWAYLYITIW